MNNQSLDLHSATFWDHAEELRRVFLKSIAVIFCGIVLALAFHQDIFHYLSLPLQDPQFHHETIRQKRVVNHTGQPQIFTLNPDSSVVSSSWSVKHTSTYTYSIPPEGYLVYSQAVSDAKLAILSPIEGMVLTLKLSFWVGLAATSPIWLYFILSFVAPALTPSTYRLVIPFILCSLLFIFGGMLFAYLLTIPIANQYLLLFNQDIGRNFWSLSHYMDYTIMLMLGNGLAFESFVIGVFLVHYRQLTKHHLRAFRRYFIVLAFVVGAILTPPDVLTQLMLAIPLILFYEAIIIYARIRSFHADMD